jgi:Sel1 repeat-containing protein
MSAAQLCFLICFLLMAGFIGFACFAFRQALAKDLAKRKAKLAEWKAGAASGDVHAQIMLAWEYARGGVIDRDLRLAAEWFEQAASSGQAEGRVHRARFLQLRRVPEGLRELRELRELAKNGNWKAQLWLGQHYRSRAGRLNKLRAAIWYGRSSKLCEYGEAARLGVLIGVARLPWKLCFVAKAALWCLAALLDQRGLDPLDWVLIYQIR